jgi:hypothetical protein
MWRLVENGIARAFSNAGRIERPHKENTVTTKLHVHAATALILAAIALAFSLPVVAQPYGPGPGYGTGAIILTPVTTAEADALKLMREEEKLARDVYNQLYQKWNLITFQNIAASEQAHFDAIGNLLTRYGVADPSQGLAAGVYTNPKLSALFNELMAKGTKSAQDALEVGVLIEKTDIADLENSLKGTFKVDVKRVYTNLMNASYNHLEAFETCCELLAAR